MMERVLTSVPDAARRTSVSRRVCVGAALAIIAASWIALCGFRGLYNPDEGRYAEIPREMLAAGNWVIPHLDGLIYIEKPPLQYWATALAYEVFGQSEWSARLYTALAGLATVLVTAWLARRLWGAAAAWRSGIVLGSSLMVLLMSHQVTLDMGLTFYMTLTLAAFCIAQRDETPLARRRGWMALAWASAAGAFLTKGLEAGAIPVLVLIVYSLIQRDRKPWARLYPLTGLAVFLALAGPWFWLIQKRLPPFFDFFIIREHFERYLTPIEQRYKPWWFFSMILALGSLPWILPSVRALVTGWRAREPGGHFDARRLLWVWCIVVLVFFSASDSKLIPYILPLFPALALLIGSAEEGRLAADLRATALGLAVAGIVLVLGAALSGPLVSHLVREPSEVPYFLGTRGPVLWIGAACLVGGILARFLGWRRGGSLPLTATIGAAAYVAFFGVVWAARVLVPLYSGAPLVAQLPQALRGIPALYGVRMYDQSLPFYLKRTVTLVEYRGELDFGLTLEPHKGIDTLAAFEPRWRAGRQALAVMSPGTFGVLAHDGLPMVVRARTPKELIVSRF
ncbi:MAG: phospholipid carrier-dependent glycosyltransferase [Steroidobacteraceae bacterium]